MVDKWLWRSLIHFGLMIFAIVWVVFGATWFYQPLVMGLLFLYGFLGGSFCWMKAHLEQEKEDVERTKRDF